MAQSIAAVNAYGFAMATTSQMARAAPQTSLSNSISMPFRLQLKRIEICDSYITYKAAHFLGLPREIRNRIYVAARDDINSQSGLTSKLSQHPLTGFEGLRQASRQLYHEVPQILGTFIVPRTFVNSFLRMPIHSHSMWDNFRSLHVEIPHDSDVEVFGCLAHALKQVARELQDLRLYGVGLDAHGIPTSSQTKACGKFDNSLFPNQRNLAISGQDWMVRLPLINTIQCLINLRTLVLDNLNMPVLEAHVLKYKDHLESLYICMDHRTTLHYEYLLDSSAKKMVRNLMWGVRQSCPLKELEISMNSTMNVGRILGLSVNTLEKLTIIVPDQSKQSACERQSNWIGDLAQILQFILRTSQKLQTLKVCIHAALYENDKWSGQLIGAFNMHMPFMLTLQTVELHIQARSRWFAQEFIEALPDSVQRFYAPELLFAGHFKAMLTMLTFKTKLDLEGYDHTKHRMIGEDPMRRDSIFFPRSELCFIGYEYALETRPTLYEMQHEYAIELLKLNAKLLDRHRNRHLAKIGGWHIPLNSKEPASLEEYNAAVTAARLGQLGGPIFDEIPELHVFATHNEYFGKEDEAVDIFYREAVAQANDLLSLTYPAFEDVSDDFRHSNHWISE